MGRTLINRPLLESEIIEAQDRSRSGAEAARYLRVSYKTYKKYADMYGIADRLKNQSGKGIQKSRSTANQGTPLADIYSGKKPDYKPWLLKKRMIDAGHKNDACEICGFDERRLIDDKVPLKLHYVDGDRTNHAFDNIQLICYNCYFLTVGNITGKQKQYFMG